MKFRSAFYYTPATVGLENPWDLPFALYPITGPFGTLPASLMGTWAILGIEDLGVQLEEPFDVLPMRQYSDGMYDAMNQIRNGYQEYEIGADERVES